MDKNKKNGFFSWLGSKIKKTKILDIIETKKEKKYDGIINKNISQNISIKKNDLASDQRENIDNKKVNFFVRLKKSLTKTKKFLGEGLNNILSSKKVDTVLFSELEEKMLLADIGVDTTNRIISNLINDINRQDLKSSEKVYYLLKKNMHSILKKVEKPLQISQNAPFVILIVGVNGTGKTTTAAKLAKKYKLAGKSVILAAADTFRAAGIEQLQILGKLNNIPVIAQLSGSDPAALVFDAIQSAKAKKIDVLIIDTAGRLHNKLHLLEELKKIVRVIKKIDTEAPHETMLIVDACNGQNTIQQTKKFHEALNITGITITKLDGTAKGGVVFALSDQFNIPIRYIGIGEKTKDLGAFSSKEFVEAIFD